MGVTSVCVKSSTIGPCQRRSGHTKTTSSLSENKDRVDHLQNRPKANSSPPLKVFGSQAHSRGLYPGRSEDLQVGKILASGSCSPFQAVPSIQRRDANSQKSSTMMQILQTNMQIAQETRANLK